MSDSLQPGSGRDDRMVDWLLGELTDAESRELQRGCARDAEFAKDTAELRCLFEDLGSLSPVIADGDSPIALAVRHSVERRLRLRRPARNWQAQDVVVIALKVAAVAAVCLGTLLIGEQTWLRTQRTPDPSKALVAHMPEAVREPIPEAAALESNSVSERHATAWLVATNEFASLCREFKNRFNPGMRRRAIRAAGGNVSLEIRIETLADELAAKIDRALATSRQFRSQPARSQQGSGLPSKTSQGSGPAVQHGIAVQDVTLALRALLAAGSSKRMGPHQAVVRRCSDYLEQHIASLEGGELATALAGLMDVAILSGGRLARLVETHTSRMIKPLIEPPKRQIGHTPIRPMLLSWNTPVSQLADAGHVLRQAAAFGVDAAAVVRVRVYISKHLAARIEQTKDERPDLLAALLYGFADLPEVDREAIEHKLRLWRASDLVPGHFVALHHVSWSSFPLRSGWADFQRDLRRVSTAETPDSITDASALLLCLAVNYAAPGCQELLDQVATR